MHQLKTLCTHRICMEAFVKKSILTNKIQDTHILDVFSYVEYDRTLAVCSAHLAFQFDANLSRRSH